MQEKGETKKYVLEDFNSLKKDRLLEKPSLLQSSLLL